MKRLLTVLALVSCVAFEPAQGKGSPELSKPSFPSVTMPADWAKAIRVAETREQGYMTGCDGSLNKYTAKVWADGKFYYVRFDGLPGSNKPYPPSFMEDVISVGSFTIIQHKVGDEPYE